MLKIPEFARVFTLSGLAAAAIAIACAQQPPSPASPPKPAAGAVTPATPAVAPESTLAPDAVVITIGDRKITRAQFEALLADAAPSATTPDKKRKIAEQYGERAIALADYAKVTAPQNPLQDPDSTYRLAQRRIALLKTSGTGHQHGAGTAD